MDRYLIFVPQVVLYIYNLQKFTDILTYSLKRFMRHNRKLFFFFFFFGGGGGGGYTYIKNNIQVYN